MWPGVSRWLGAGEPTANPPLPNSDRQSLVGHVDDVLVVGTVFPYARDL
jgi:hypothetical protein